MRNFCKNCTGSSHGIMSDMKLRSVGSQRWIDELRLSSTYQAMRTQSFSPSEDVSISTPNFEATMGVLRASVERHAIWRI